MANKFSNLLNTQDFIKLQLMEKKCPNQNPITLKFIESKILLPQKLYTAYILFFHKSLGHIGAEKMYNYLNSYYFLVNKKHAKAIIENISASCLGCLQSKQLTHRYKEGSAQFSKVENVNDLLYADLLEFPTFEYHLKNNKKTKNSKPPAVLIIKDVFSDYTTLYMLHAKTASALRNCFVNYFSTHGTAKKLCTDNAKIFKSKLLKDYLKGLNINILESSVLKSKTRGFIEYCVKKVNTILRLYRRRLPRLDPYHILSTISVCLNKIPFRNEVLTPYNIQFNSVDGFEGTMYSPESKIFNYKIDLEKPLVETLSEYGQDFRSMVIKVRNHILKFKKRIIDKKNVNRTEHNIKTDDYVLIKTFDRSYEKKYKPIFGDKLYRVVKARNFTVILEQVLTGQLIYRHITDVKRLDFGKMSKVKIPEYLANSFEIITISNIETMFEIEKLSSSSDRIRIKIKDVQNLMDEPSEDDEDLYTYDENLDVINPDILSDIEEEDFSDNSV